MKRMALNEWLASPLRLCELNAQVGCQSTDTLLGPEQGLLKVIFDCPLPVYEKSDVMSSLMAYAQAMKDAETRGLNANQTIALVPRGQGLASFALALTQSILHSAKSQWENSTFSGPQNDGPDEPQRTLRAPVPTDSPAGGSIDSSNTGPTHKQMEDLSDMDEEDKDDFTPPLAQTSLPSEGSIDYPNAPPTSPLLVEKVTSPMGFSRSLKRGLANGFHPSPPPPTPKEQADPVENDDQPDFVARLMRSLSLECAKGESCSWRHEECGASRVGLHQAEMPGLSEYATRLSSEIIGCFGTSGVEGTEEPIRGEKCASIPPVHTHQQPMMSLACATTMNKGPSDTGAPGRVEDDPAEARRLLHAAADQWMQAAVAAALFEVASNPEVDSVGSRLSSSRQFTKHEGHSKAAEQRDPDMEDLDTFAKALVRQIVQQAVLFFQTGLESQVYPSFGQWNNRRTSLLDSGPRGSEMPSAPSWHSFAACLTEEVLKDSILEASKRKSPAHTYEDAQLWVAHRGRGGSEVTALLGETSHGTSRVLQGLILWAAASYTKASKLHLTFPDAHLHAQFCSAVQGAHLIGRTVGELVTSLLQFCKQQEKVTDMWCLSDAALLQYLEGQLGGDSELCSL